MSVLVVYVICTLCLCIVGGETSKCELQSIGTVKPSLRSCTFQFEPVFKKTDDCVRENLFLYMKRCDDKSKIRLKLELTKNGMETYIIPETGGNFMVVDYHVTKNYSNCFWLPGTRISPTMRMDLWNTHLDVKFFKQEENPHVATWNVSVYEVTQEPGSGGDVYIGYDHYTLEGNKTDLRLNYDFKLEKCYCFRLIPIGYGNTKLTSPKNFISTKTCRPKGMNQKSSPITAEDEAFIPIIISLAVLAILAAIFLIIGKKLLAYEIQGTDPVFEQYNSTDLEKSFLLSTGHKILVVYAAHDKDHNEKVAKLINEIIEKTGDEVLDVNKSFNDDRLDDPNDWLEKHIKTVKVLVILSPTLCQYQRTVLSMKEKSDDNEKDEKATMLVYALRQLITMNDYSRVFVARFSSENNDQDDIQFVTNRRRYMLPKHQDELLQNFLWHVKSKDSKISLHNG